MAQYIASFRTGEVDMEVLPHLSYLDLKELGVQWQRERQFILQKAAELCTSSDPMQPSRTHKRLINGDPKSSQPPSVASPKLGKNLRQMSLLETVKPNGISFPKKDSQPLKATPKIRGGLNTWQCIPGTDFVVDRFKGIGYLKNQHWFLTHFHSDHYGGLSSSFSKGTIYCSATTARLCQSRLRVDPNRLLPIPLHEKVNIAGAQVTFVDANHCPGSVMIIVENDHFPSVLHTGDARLTPEMYKTEAVERLKGRGCVLVLDTTYCDPKYTFPPQKDVIRYVCDTVMAEMFHLKTLFLFGTYGIGKERLFLEVAKRANRSVYVSREKKQALECMELTSEEKSLLTVDHEATNIHAVSLWNVGLDSMRRILANYGSRYTHVIGFRPTGWSYQKGKEKTKCGRRNVDGKITIYQANRCISARSI